MGLSNEEKEAINFQLKRKLNPARFSGMSPKMAVIVGYFLDEKFTGGASKLSNDSMRLRFYGRK